MSGAPEAPTVEESVSRLYVGNGDWQPLDDE